MSPSFVDAQASLRARSPPAAARSMLEAGAVMEGGARSEEARRAMLLLSVRV